MIDWKLMTFTGVDKKGIVAAVSRVLEQNQFNMGESNMIRLAGNFTIMIMAKSTQGADVSNDDIKVLFNNVLADYSLSMHIDDVPNHDTSLCEPNINIAIHCADRAGIVADVTEALKTLDFNIVDLYSDMGGESEQPFYVLNIEGESEYSSIELEKMMEEKLGDEIKVIVSSIDLLIA